MKALSLDAPGGRLIVREIPVPSPGRGEVLIKIHAAPVNPSDLNRLKSLTTPEEIHAFVPGIEGCGTVVETGTGILPWLWKGKRVACTSVYPYSGTWAEYMVTHASKCFPVPAHIPDEQAAMLFVNPLTALAFIDIIRKEGHRAVISQASGSALGKMIIKLARKHKITVINIVRNTCQAENLKNLGAEAVISTDSPDFSDRMAFYIDQYRPTLLLDPVGGSFHQKLLEKMPPGARTMVYGTLSGEMLEIYPRTLIAEDKSIAGFFLGNYLKKKGVLSTMRMLFAARNLLSEKDAVTVREKVSLNNAPAAIERYLQKMSAGKIIILPDA